MEQKPPISKPSQSGLSALDSIKNPKLLSLRDWSRLPCRPVGYLCWRLGFLPDLTAWLPITPANLSTPDLSFGGALTRRLFSRVESYRKSPGPASLLALHRCQRRRSWPASWIVGSRFFGVDLLLVPLLFTGVLSLLFVQVNRLWSLDRQFARTLLNSPVNNSDSSISANARLMSGLKLLNTVLPLNEAVVFHCVESDSLEAVARFKGTVPNAQDPRRNSVWREGIELCQQAAANGKLVSQTTRGQLIDRRSAAASRRRNRRRATDSTCFGIFS